MIVSCSPTNKVFKEGKVRLGAENVVEGPRQHRTSRHEHLASTVYQSSDGMRLLFCHPTKRKVDPQDRIMRWKKERGSLALWYCGAVTPKLRMARFGRYSMILQISSSSILSWKLLAIESRIAISKRCVHQPNR